MFQTSWARTDWLWLMFLLPTTVWSQSVGIPRYPHASRTQIVFQYEDKLWLVPRAGGLAKSVPTDVAVKREPRFSADGDTIAFIGAHDGTDSGAATDRDPQLERAIAVTIAAIRQFKYTPAVAPPSRAAKRSPAR